MKKSFFSLIVLLIVSSYSLKAQINLIAVQHGNTPSFYQQVDDAIVNAQDGDTIYIPGGTWNITQAINKRLHIIGVDIHLAREKMLEEIMMTVETPITAYELEKVKNRVEADLLLNEIGYLEKAIQLASFEIMGDASEINRQGEKYRDITAADLLATAGKLFRKGNRNTLNYLSLQNPGK